MEASQQNISKLKCGFCQGSQYSAQLLIPLLEIFKSNKNI